MQESDKLWYEQGVRAGYLEHNLGHLAWLQKARKHRLEALWDLRHKPVPKDYVMRVLEYEAPYEIRDLETLATARGLLARARIPDSSRRLQTDPVLGRKLMAALGSPYAWAKYMEA
jgi:hypothetical protein